MADDGPDGWGAPLHARVLELAGVAAGTTLLDLGCGPGLFARAAVDRGAVVTGVDVNPAVVAAAERAVPEGRFRVGDAEEPPPGPFDVVAGKGSAFAASLPGDSPLAHDVQAGYMGLTIPAMVGAMLSVAVPAFTGYLEKSKRRSD